MVGRGLCRVPKRKAAGHDPCRVPWPSRRIPNPALPRIPPSFRRSSTGPGSWIPTYLPRLMMRTVSVPVWGAVAECIARSNVAVPSATVLLASKHAGCLPCRGSSPSRTVSRTTRPGSVALPPPPSGAGCGIFGPGGVFRGRVEYLVSGAGTGIWSVHMVLHSMIRGSPAATIMGSP